MTYNDTLRIVCNAHKYTITDMMKLQKQLFKDSIREQSDNWTIKMKELSKQWEV